MRVTVVDVLGNIATVELDGSSLIEDLKALIEVEMNIPYANQLLTFENKRLDDKATLSASNIKDGDMLHVQNNSNNQLQGLLNAFQQGLARQQGQGQGQGQGFGQAMNPQAQFDAACRKEAQDLKNHYMNNANEMQYILHQNPEFAQAIVSDDINVLVEMVKKQKLKKIEEQKKHLERIRQLEEDPFNPDNQRLIEEEIRMKNVNENMEFAQEYTPEVFGSVTMLYIDAKINGHPIQAFVDSGAQSTIMSHAAASRCGLDRLLDKRFAGMAVGVGTSRILGRIHSTKLEIGGKHFMCSITVLEDDKVEFLFGLDMLKRHQCCIDLNKNALTFHGGELSVPFLAEGEVKKHFADSARKDEKIIEEAAKNHTIIKEGPGAQQAANKSAGGQGGASGGFSEDDIGKLTGLGFTRNDAINALKLCMGNVDLAASYLFQNY